jgi:hypothetical protein
VYDAALGVLESRDPEYIEKCLRDVANTNAIKPLKGLPRKWRETMEAMVSYEFAMEKVKTAVRFLGTQCPFPDSVCTEGQWADFHLEAWMNLTYSWQEKLEVLIKRVYRNLPGAQESDAEVRKKLISELHGLWTSFNNTRGEYVHNTGAVSAISDGPGWEATLVLNLDVAAHPYLRNHEYVISRRTNWHKWLFDATARQLANIENVFQQLNANVFPGHE